MLGFARLGASGARPAATVVATEAPVAPYEAAPRLLDRARPVFLDSSLAGSGTGRYSYLTAEPFLIVRSRGRRVELTGSIGTVVLRADPFDVIQCLLRHYRVAPVPGLPPFLGGAIGYFGYDLGRLLERQPTLTRDADGLPDLNLGFYDWVLAADHLTGKNWHIETVFSPREENEANARIRDFQERLTRPMGSLSRWSPPRQRLRSNLRRGDYLDAVRRVQDYIAAGDVYQVNLSHRLEGRWRGPTWPLYERLRAASPVPYGAYLALGDVTILSASPERFLQVDPEGMQVETRPIKGTRPRGATAGEDRALAADLLRSEKDRAENVMIVDLLRNDIGKVCQVGSVRVPELLSLEPYATVWQLVSAITGTLRPELDAVDLLRACFPGGSVTGCPKIRAMEIIEELEPVRRGIYCGAIGCLSFTGAMDTSIVIRTLVHVGEQLHLQVGGAIVAESDPSAEYAETIAKARAGLDALGAEVEDW
ncbi:MAG: para-aminobenzoate synthetase component [Thermomicrobiales bacterium]|nr:para-aminobenzoate synthetase component [Thermomicrobiales bacterium]